MGLLSFKIGSLIGGLNVQQLQDAYAKMDDAAKSSFHMALFGNVGIVIALLMLAATLICLIFFNIESEKKLNEIQSEIKELRQSTKSTND